MLNAEIYTEDCSQFLNKEDEQNLSLSEVILKVRENYLKTGFELEINPSFIIPCRFNIDIGGASMGIIRISENKYSIICSTYEESERGG